VTGRPEATPTERHVKQKLRHKSASRMHKNGVSEQLLLKTNSNLYRIKPAVYEHPHDGSTFTILNRRPWRVQHSIMMNAMWQRFDQSAKQLIVGHTTKISIYRRADRIAGRTTPTRCWHPAQYTHYTAQWYNAPSRVSANRLTSCRHNTVPLYTTHWHGPPEHVMIMIMNVNLYSA